jgi:hypothetical protein
MYHSRLGQVKWHKSFTKRAIPLPSLLSAVIPCFVDLKDDPAVCHQQLVEFLKAQPPTFVSTPVSSSVLQPTPAPHEVVPNPIPAPPATLPLVATSLRPHQLAGSSMILDDPPPVASVPTNPLQSVTLQPVAGPSRPRLSNVLQIGRPARLPHNAVPLRSTHVSRPRRQPRRQASEGKDKQTFYTEHEEEDELESEEETEGQFIKQEPLSGLARFQDHARKVELEIELQDEANSSGPRTRSSVANANRRIPKPGPKTPALFQETDDEDTPSVVDRFAAAGENDPPCNNCAGRNVPCHYVVDEWVTQCKLCQRQKVGCSVSAQKVLALKKSGRKRPRPTKGTTAQAPVKREAKPPKVPRLTPVPRRPRTKRAGDGIGSCGRETSE